MKTGLALVVTILLFLSMPAKDASAAQSYDFETALRTAAREKCSYGTYHQVRTERESNGAMVYTFACGNIFNVRTVRCTAYEDKTRRVVYECH